MRETINLSAPPEEMELNLKYSGQPVREGRMSGRELGPALFGMAEVLERTAAVMYGDECSG